MKYRALALVFNSCRFDGMFPDENTPDLLFDGVRFADLPIIHASFSKNNTLLTLTDAKGRKTVATLLS